ncbi:MAG: DUF5916 domain-containing protein [Bacteroidales bacterium]
MKRTSLLFAFGLVLGLTAAPGVLRAQIIDSLLQNKRIYHTQSIEGYPLPKIDGILDDSIWTLGEWQGDFTQQQPVGGAPGTEQTFIKILYDKNNLYVATKFMDREPELIRDIFGRRDELNGDMGGVALDSYFDKRTAFEFNVTAAGQKVDIKHLGDYQWDFNWDGVWDGASSRIDSGWVSEMQIPFSQLRYSNKEEQVWGLHYWRWIARRSEESQWQYIPKDAPAMVYLFGELHGIHDIRTSRQVEFLPYVLSSVERPASGDGFDPFRLNAGIDAKVGISSDFTLDLSINPDFGQVEADPSVLNLTSFETFYEEKRPFFLEGNEIFDFEMDGDIPFYSRRVGSAPALNGFVPGLTLSELPQRTTILGAAKLTGRTRKGLSVGLVNGLTAEEFATGTDAGGTDHQVQVAPMSNYLSSRIKREFNDNNTIVGGVFNLVKRMSADSLVDASLVSGALTGGLDVLHYWDQKNYYFSAKAIASQMQGSPQAILAKQLDDAHRFQRPDADYLLVDPARESLGGHGALVEAGKNGGKINFRVTGQYRSPGLNLNDMGYLREADFMGQGVSVSYRVNEPGDWVRSYTLDVEQEARWSFGGENTRNRWSTGLNLSSNSLWSFIVALQQDFSHLDIRELRGGPALRVDPSTMLGMRVGSNPNKDLYGAVMGHVYHHGLQGSNQKNATLSLTWLPVRKIKLSALTFLERRQYHQQYVGSLQGTDSWEYVVGRIDQRSASLTFRGELFLNPELSLQYYASPFYSSGKYDDFSRVTDARALARDDRFQDLGLDAESGQDTYSYEADGSTWNFANPDFSFMQFRSNLVLRWEYKLGSTLYLVWAHDRSGFESLFNPVQDITGDLWGIRGNHVLMFKLNFWFSV